MPGHIMKTRRLVAALAACLFWPRSVCASTLPRAATLSIVRAPSDATAAASWAAQNAPLLHELNALCFANARGMWTTQQIVEACLKPSSMLLSAWHGDDAVVAFASVDAILDESHLEMLSVHPEWRRAGLARLLVLATLASAQAIGHRLVTLEVRESNAAAILLYESCGFAQVGRRPRYYRRPQEDAVLLTAHLLDVEDGDTTSDRTRLLVDVERLVAARPHDAQAVIRRAAEGASSTVGSTTASTDECDSCRLGEVRLEASLGG